jgi:hypothetical protein
LEKREWMNDSKKLIVFRSLSIDENDRMIEKKIEEENQS